MNSTNCSFILELLLKKLPELHKVTLCARVCHLPQRLPAAALLLLWLQRKMRASTLLGCLVLVTADHLLAAAIMIPDETLSTNRVVVSNAVSQNLYKGPPPVLIVGKSVRFIRRMIGTRRSEAASQTRCLLFK